MKLLFIAAFLLLLSATLVSAVPITLDHIDVNFTNSSWCMNSSQAVFIAPMDINNNSVLVDNVGVIISPRNITYTTSIATFDSAGKYYYFYINLNSINFTDFNISFSATQSGKTVYSNVTHISESDCSGFSVISTASSIDKFLQDNWLSLALFCILIIFIILIIVAIRVAQK